MKVEHFVHWTNFCRDVRAPEAARQRSWQAISMLVFRSPFWRPQWTEADANSLEHWPLTTYEDYRRALEESFSGRTSTLNGEEILHWATSSGSTGEPKLFPWTESSQDVFRSILMCNALHVVRNYPSAIALGTITLVTLNPKRRSPSGITVGYLGNHLFRRNWVGLKVRYPVSTLDDADVARFWVPAYCLAEDAGTLTAVIPETILRFLDAIDAKRSAYVECLTGGTKQPMTGAPLDVTSQRLAYVQDVLQSSEPLTLKRLWPGLRYVTTWVHASAGLQLNALRERLGPGVDIVDNPYGASEACATVQIDNTHTGGILHPGGEIFEFLPAGSEATSKNLVPSWELEVGKLYEPIITTRMGFIRYRMGDLVRCSGFHERAPRLYFEGRVEREVSFGLSTIGEREIIEAYKRCGLSISGEWLVCPNELGNGLRIYTSGGHAEYDIAGLDECLGALNPTFAANLASHIVQPTTLGTLPPNHPLWVRARPGHAQAKRRILFDQPAGAAEP